MEISEGFEKFLQEATREELIERIIQQKTTIESKIKKLREYDSVIQNKNKQIEDLKKLKARTSLKEDKFYLHCKKRWEERVGGYFNQTIYRQLQAKYNQKNSTRLSEYNKYLDYKLEKYKGNYLCLLFDKQGILNTLWRIPYVDYLQAKEKTLARQILDQYK